VSTTNHDGLMVETSRSVRKNDNKTYCCL